MGQVYALSPLVPGSRASISRDRRVLRIEQVGRVEFLDPLQPKKPVSPANGMTFDTLLEVPESAKRACVLVRGDMAFDGAFTPRALDLIKKGACYTTTLAGASEIDLGEPNTEIECDFALVLSESSRGAVLLGVIHAVSRPLGDDESIVSVLDLLGFSHIMTTESVEEIERKYTQTLFSRLTFVGLTSIGGFVFDDHGNLDASEDLWTVSYGVFSDTVILYPKKSLPNPLRTICEAAAHTIDFGLQMGWLFRGGIEVGTFRAHPEHNLYLGKALIGAHMIEMQQDWSGCVVGPGIMKRFPEEVAELKKEQLLVEYTVPFKDISKIKSVFSGPALALNWCFFDTAKTTSRGSALRQQLTRAPSEAKRKLQNTIEFEKAMKTLGAASIRKIGGVAFGDPTGGDTE